jgi:iron complex transport system ATP-binding protein
MSKAVELNDLDLFYRDDRILDKVSFSVAEGEFFIIIGPNGSGKTSLLKAISGVNPLSGGAVKILNKDLNSYSRKELACTVAVVTQHLSSNFSFTVRELVLMGRSPHLGLMGFETKNDLQIAERAMEATGVSHLAGRRMSQLSGGEQQRVMIARAVCQEPRVLLLDEPTASLDLAHQVNIMDLMEKLRDEQGMTIIMVAHDLNLAALYADRLLLLKQGRVLSLGKSREVLTFQTLERAFGCVLLVDESPLDKVPRVSLIPGRCLHGE